MILGDLDRWNCNFLICLVENCWVIFGGRGHVSLVYSREVGPKGRALVGFYLIKKRVNLKNDE